MAEQYPPPDLDEIVRALKRNTQPLFTVVGIAIVVLIGLSTYYSVAPDEQAVVLRFGRFVETTGPGPHFKIPIADRIEKVPVGRKSQVEFGFRTENADIQTRYSKANFSAEAVMLTGDLNVADVQWIVQYQVSDPRAFKFNVRNVQKNIRDIAEASMRLVVGDRTVTDVLTVGRQEIGTQVQEIMQKSVDHHNMGIRIVTVNLQNVNPPDPVKPSFNEVNAAKQEQEKVINEARRAYNREIPRAQGEAQQLIAEAQGYALQRVNEAKGDAERFQAMYAEYRKAPEITRTRLYLESMEEIFPEAQRVIVADPAVKSLLPLLNLDAGGQK